MSIKGKKIIQTDEAGNNLFPMSVSDIIKRPNSEYSVEETLKRKMQYSLYNDEEITSELPGIEEDVNSLKQEIEDAKGDNITIAERLSCIDNRIKKTSTVISLEHFIVTGDNSIDDAFDRALDYCKKNNSSLFIPDGEYLLLRPIIIDIDSFTLSGNSFNTKLIPKHNGIVIHLKSHRCTIENIFIYNTNKTLYPNVTGINCSSSQSNITNIRFYNCYDGILFNTNCWCTNATKLNITGAHYGITFDEGSGGNYVDFILIDGDAGYQNTVPNGSCAFVFKFGTGHHVIGDGGQVSSFNYVFDIQQVEEFRPSKVERIYIEHCLSTFTPSSRGTIKMENVHGAYFCETPIIKMTSHGINKSEKFNVCKDSGIPVNDLLAYFTFSSKNPLKDLSTNNSTITGLDGSIDSDDYTKNLFGRSVKIKPLTTTNALLNIPNLTSKFTIICSFRLDNKDVVDTGNVRLFNFYDKRSTKIADFILTSSAKNATALTLYDYSKPGTTRIFADPMYDDYNAFVAISFDGETGRVISYSPSRYTINETSDKYKFNSGDIALQIFRTFLNDDNRYVFNYLSVFDGVLKEDEVLNVYNKTTPLI